MHAYLSQSERATHTRYRAVERGLSLSLFLPLSARVVQPARNAQQTISHITFRMNRLLK